MQSPQRVRIRAATNVIDRDACDQFRSAISRAAVGIDDHGPLSGKPAQDAALNGFYYRTDRLGVVVGRQPHEDVYFAHVLKSKFPHSKFD